MTWTHIVEIHKFASAVGFTCNPQGKVVAFNSCEELSQRNPCTHMNRWVLGRNCHIQQVLLVGVGRVGHDKKFKVAGEQCTCVSAETESFNPIGFCFQISTEP